MNLKKIAIAVGIGLASLTLGPKIIQRGKENWRNYDAYQMQQIEKNKELQRKVEWQDIQNYMKQYKRLNGYEK